MPCTLSGLSDVKDLTYGSFSCITSDVGQNAEHQATPKEQEYRRQGGVEVNLVIVHLSDGSDWSSEECD